MLSHCVIISGVQSSVDSINLAHNRLMMYASGLSLPLSDQIEYSRVFHSPQGSVMLYGTFGFANKDLA